MKPSPRTGQTATEHSALLDRLIAARRLVRQAAGVPASLSAPEPSLVGWRAPLPAEGELGGLVAVYDEFLSPAEAQSLVALGTRLAKNAGKGARLAHVADTGTPAACGL